MGQIGQLLLEPENKGYICSNDLFKEVKEDFDTDIISANYSLNYVDEFTP